MKHGVTLYKGAKVTKIDRTARTVTAEFVPSRSGQPSLQPPVTVAYDKLIVATGSNPIIIPVPGHDLPGVLSYRDLDDVEAMATARSRAQQRSAPYAPAIDSESEIPAWIDATLRKAVHPDPNKRYGELSEFIFDLRHPNEAFLRASTAPLIERNPLAFWKGLSFVLAAAVLALIALHFGR